MTDHTDTRLMLAANVACIPSNYSRVIARELELQTRELPKLLALTNLSIEQFTEEEALFTPRQQIQILENAMRLTKHDDIGLRFGKRLTPTTHGAMGFLANSSPNFVLALQAFQDFLPTRVNFIRLELSSTDDWVECRSYFDIEVNADAHRILSETVMTVLFECAEFIVGRPITEAVTSFSHTEPAYSARYGEYMAGQFEFSAPQLKLRVPQAICQIPNVSANHENYSMALKQCETMLTQLLSDKQSSQYQVQKMMLLRPPGSLTEDEAAAGMFISKRTLARRLQKEGTSFRQIREEILSQQASDYLRESQMSVDAIAALLNYHDSANFRRAFKRWFDMPPDQYRRQAAMTTAVAS